ncbi:MAG: MCE family protein [Saprospiraceae bacterium]|nr:MCE family protein [Saprospiraceae bacterium]
MSREIKIGIFALSAILLLIFGYQFLKGKSIFSRTQTFYIHYDNVSQLSKSDPVLLNGYQVGLVRDIYQDPEDMQKLIVVLDVQQGIKVPDQTVAELNTTSVMGGKAVVLNLKGACCKESGDYLEGKTLSMLNSMIGQDEMDGYLDIAKSFQRLADSLISKIPGKESMGATGETLEAIINNVRVTTELLNVLLAKQGPTYQTLDNLQGITGNLEGNNDQITGTLQNINKLTADLQAAELSKTIAELNATLTALQTTLGGANVALQDIAALTDALKTSKGTLGLLINDRAMYDQLDETLVHMELLLQDIRLNPKRYTRILSKKEKEYEAPEEDPGIKD